LNKLGRNGSKMGGNLFSERRVSLAEYNDIQREVFTILNTPEAKVPRSFSEKKDFGDLDICLELPVITEEVIREKFCTDKTFLNTSVLSFGYKEFQIDLCHYPAEDLESAVNYMAFGDTSNMIGVIANYAMGLRFTHRGLVCPVKLKQEEPLGEILISKDMAAIMGFMDLDYNAWDVGFKTEEEVFIWISKSKYFNPEFFKFENLNHQNKTRNRKRAMYSRFVKWLEPGKSEGHICWNNYECKNKSEHIWRAMLTFGNDWIDAAKPLISEHRDEQTIRNTFNGNDIKLITGLDKKELGDMLCSYKASVGDWNNFVLARDKQSVTEHFKQWYEKTLQNTQG
jgi:5-methylcytosine-specific restriction endonuclease McrA